MVNTFARRLRTLRKQHGLLQKDVAKKLGITASAYGYYEQGKREPTIEIINKLASIFGVTTDYLLGNTDSPGENNKLDTLDLEKAIKMIEEGKAHFGGHELNKEDRDFLAKIIRLAIERKQKQGKENE